MATLPTVPHLTRLEATEAQIRAACLMAGCQEPHGVDYSVWGLEWVIVHGLDRLTLERMSYDVLASWLRDLHRPLVEARTLRDHWPVRQVDPLMGG